MWLFVNLFNQAFKINGPHGALLWVIKRSTTGRNTLLSKCALAIRHKDIIEILTFALNFTSGAIWLVFIINISKKSVFVSLLCYVLVTWNCVLKIAPGSFGIALVHAKPVWTRHNLLLNIPIYNGFQCCILIVLDLSTSLVRADDSSNRSTSSNSASSKHLNEKMLYISYSASHTGACQNFDFSRNLAC